MKVAQSWQPKNGSQVWERHAPAWQTMQIAPVHELNGTHPDGDGNVFFNALRDANFTTRGTRNCRCQVQGSFQSPPPAENTSAQRRLPLARAAFIAFLLLLPSAFAQNAAPAMTRGALMGDRFRVVVSSDIGGSDPDDYQSMVHFLVYADVFDVEGLISSPPKQGRAEHIHATIDAYEKDFPNLVKASKDYPKPERLRGLVKQGAIDPAPAEGFSQPTEGSRWLIERAHADDARPLYVLVWGSITDVAQAVHDDPSIKSELRVYSIGSWNTANDRASRNYLFKEHPDLWLIEADSTFRGMYVGGQQTGEWDNKTFLDQHVRGHGALGDFLVEKLDAIKMGDTPSVLYLLMGDPDDPTAPNWGGSFVKTDHGPNYWTDSPDPQLAEGKYPGAKTVNIWREDFLKDWRDRMDRVAGKAKEAPHN